MKVCFTLLLTAVVMALATVHSHAYGPETDQLPMTGRIRGLGGAVTSLAEPLTGFLVQPASISYLEEKHYFQMPHLLLEMSPSAGSFFSQVNGLSMNIVDLNDALRSTPDKLHHLRASTMLAYYRPNIAYALIADYQMDEVYSSTHDAIFSSIYLTNTAVMNIAKEFGPKKNVSWGLTFKLSYRMGNDVSYNQGFVDFDPSKTLGITKSAREGLGLGIDSGLLWRQDLGEDLHLSVGGAVINLGGLPYFALHTFERVDKGLPRRLDMQVNGGASLLFKNFGPFDLRFALDVKHLTRWTIKTQNHFALGMEIRFKKFLSILLGTEGLGWSGGFELRYWLVTAHFVFYNEEVGRYLSGSKKNLRWQFELQFLF